MNINIHLHLLDHNITDIPPIGRNCSRTSCLVDAVKAERDYRRSCSRLPAIPKAACYALSVTLCAAADWMCSNCNNP